jgi:hypothetical protein
VIVRRSDKDACVRLHKMIAGRRGRSSGFERKKEVMDLGWLTGGRVVLDEGGIRASHDGVDQYVAYVEIDDVSIGSSSLLGRAHLTLSIENDRIVNASLPLNISVDQAAIEIRRRCFAARATMGRMTEQRRDLATWIASVVASHAVDRGGAMYRSTFVDLEMLERTLADTTDVIQARAASAHALLARGRPEIVKPHITKLSPPLVVVATRLAPNGETIVSDAMIEDVLPFLEIRDRVVFAQRRQLQPRVA